MGTTEKIKMIMVANDITQKELAAKLGISQPTLSGKFKLNDWRESDLRKIAAICNCEYKSSFMMDGREIQMVVSEAKKKANNKWVNANYKRINIALPKEEAEAIDNFCKEKKISKNGFFRQAAKEKMEREK